MRKIHFSWTVFFQSLIRSFILATEEGAKGEGYFHDDTVPTFFRRIAWSPDGNLLVCPTGKAGENNSSFVFARAALPYAVLELPVSGLDSDRAFHY